MPSAPERSQEKLKVFISYSHVDESLKDKLEKHLAALRRSNVIETWNDRRIGPGEEWKKEIDRNLFEADVILLLISSDFLHSDFCYLIETRNALDRHAQGQALVIPVVLRDVDFKGLPIAELQMLPKDARAVTSGTWKSEDEAFKNVAEGIRTAIGNFRDQRSDRREIQAQPRTELEPRYLDAAIAGEIPVGMTREVAALVRIGESQGLSAVLSSTDASRSQYSCSPSDVRSEPFDARYQVMDRARTSPAYRLTVDAPDLIVEDEDKHFTIEWGRDSITFKFFVKANRAGEQRLRVNLYAGTLAAAELLLKTRAGGSPPPGGVIKKMDRLVASVQLMLNVINRSASAGSA